MRVITSPGAERDIERLSPEMTQRVLRALHALQDDPRPPGCLLLRDRRPPTWRLRVGDWRVFYRIDDRAGIVTITGVRHRSQAY